MENIDKYKLLGVMIRGFFEAFPSGIIDCSVTDAAEKFKPQKVKKVMLEHYEHISEAFHDTLFYPIAVMNFSFPEVERILVEATKNGLTMLELVQKVCGDDALYEALKAEYRRNFSLLLSGRYASAASHLRDYTRAGGESAPIPTDKAIRLTVRTVMIAYARGLRYAAKGKTSLHQASVFRLLLDAMTVLLGDDVVAFDDADAADLGSMFIKACRSKHNFDVMTAEMDEVYGMLAEREGITAADDCAN